jgi:CheY-like chemotaxis protein
MKKVLLIEDDQIVANIYRNRFSVEGFEVETATDGLAGLDMVTNFKPDAVLLDLMLPKMNGVEFMKQLRSRPESSTLPVIVFSNTYLTNLVQEAWKAGATKCLSKASCTPKQVIDVVRSVIGVEMPASGASAVIEKPNGYAKANGHANLNGSAAKSSSAPVAPAAAAPASDPGGDFRSQLQTTLTGLRAQLQGLFKAANEELRLKQVQELYRRIHTLTGSSAAVGLIQIANVADALEALLKELYEKPKNINASTLRTVASAIDFLGVLGDRGLEIAKQPFPACNILVVDDEAISRRAVLHSLDKAKLKCNSSEDPNAALELIKKNVYDIVILDVDMPGMNGFELCAKIRTMPAYKKVPVVFVTGLNDFESRANSTMSGGNDFIAKPFLFMELALKALVFILRTKIS